MDILIHIHGYVFPTFIIVQAFTTTKAPSSIPPNHARARTHTHTHTPQVRAAGAPGHLQRAALRDLLPRGGRLLRGVHGLRGGAQAEPPAPRPPLPQQRGRAGAANKCDHLMTHRFLFCFVFIPLAEPPVCERAWLCTRAWSYLESHVPPFYYIVTLPQPQVCERAWLLTRAW